MFQAGKFDVHLDHRGLEPSVNRLVLGMLTSALFLGSALILSTEVPPLLFPENTYLKHIYINYPGKNVSFAGLGIHWIIYYLVLVLILVLALRKRFGVEF